MFFFRPFTKTALIFRINIMEIRTYFIAYLFFRDFRKVSRHTNRSVIDIILTFLFIYKVIEFTESFYEGTVSYVCIDIVRYIFLKQVGSLIVFQFSTLRQFESKECLRVFHMLFDYSGIKVNLIFEYSFLQEIL